MTYGYDVATLEGAAQAAFRACVRAGLGEADARDLAQEALCAALTRARPASADVPLAAWVYGIARNLCRDHAKAAGRREVPTAAPPDVDAPPDDLATVLSVRAAIDALPAGLRDVVTLHELEEHTLAETAASLQIPFDTAKDRLRRARDTLRAALADEALRPERAQARRRAAAVSAAIVVGALLLAERADAAAPDTSSAAGAARRVVRARRHGAWLAVGGAALVGLGIVIGRASERAAVPDRAPAVIAVAPRAPAIDAAPAIPPPPPVPAPAPAPAPAPPVASPRASRGAPAAPTVAPPPASPLPDGAAERLLLDRARTALHRARVDDATVALMTHARQFPDGALAEERDAMLIEAYVRAGRREVARARLDAYRATYPHGVLRDRVDALAAQLAPP